MGAFLDEEESVIEGNWFEVFVPTNRYYMPRIEMLPHCVMLDSFTLRTRQFPRFLLLASDLYLETEPSANLNPEWIDRMKRLKEHINFINTSSKQ